MFKTSLAAICAAALLLSCVTPQQGLRSDVPIQTLNICMEGTSLIPETVLAGFNRELDAFIVQHNRTPHKFKLNRVVEPGENTVFIKLHQMQFVTPQQQAGAVALNLVGFSLPFIMVSAGSPIYLFFYYFPTVKTITETTLSQDISKSIANPAVRRYDSPGFLMNPERQQARHIELFDRRYLTKLVRELEKSYKPR
jgi:hypothetical protein